MRSVVMIAYFFPPEGSAGVYRPLRFLRHLPATGWRARVISLDTNFYERYDPDLLALVPSDTKVLRVRGRDPWQTIQAKRAKRNIEKLSSASAETVAQMERCCAPCTPSFPYPTVCAHCRGMELSP